MLYRPARVMPSMAKVGAATPNLRSMSFAGVRRMIAFDQIVVRFVPVLKRVVA